MKAVQSSKHVLGLAEADLISEAANEVCLQPGRLYLGHMKPGTHRGHVSG